MIGIIDYGVGNLFSLRSSFRAIDVETFVSGDPKELEQATHLVLPGVGAFEDAAKKLKSTGLDAFVREQAGKGVPLLGICLGMQLLFEKSYEYGVHEGLGLLPGQVVPMAQQLPDGLKVPHMGWNSLRFCKDSQLFSHIREGDFVYFVHSYYAQNCGDALSATAEYGIPVTAAVEQDNIFGCQFHPEKSGEVGLKILRAFSEVKGV